MASARGRERVAPTEKTSGATIEETTHTDPGPVMDEPANQRDWSNLEDRYQMIAEATYYKAEQRGFELGDAVLDWPEAEQEQLAARRCGLSRLKSCICFDPRIPTF